MGVQDLMKYCTDKHNKDKLFQLVDLVHEAAKARGIEILVNFRDFEDFIALKLAEILSKDSNNPYLKILGGEYLSASTYLQNLIRDLSDIGISLVFFLDADVRDDSENGFKNKTQIDDIVDVISGTKKIRQIDSHHLHSALHRIQFEEILKITECEIITVLDGNINSVMAKALRDRRKAYAVLSDDSDFCIFKNCRLITYKCFDVSNDLQFSRPLDHRAHPTKVMAEVLTTQRIMESLGIWDHLLMVELSILAGNDFTLPYIGEDLKEKLALRGKRGIGSIAGWVKQHKRVPMDPKLLKEMYQGNSKAFADAVLYSRKFFTLSLQNPQTTKKDRLSKVIEDGVIRRKFSYRILGFHDKFYRHQLMIDMHTPGQTCSEDAMKNLRTMIYRMVLKRDVRIVKEIRYGPCDAEIVDEVLADEDRNIPTLEKINEEDVPSNLRHFHFIMTHMEREQGLLGTTNTWFDDNEPKAAFKIYIMRYFLLLNWNMNLHVTEDEVTALTALVIGKKNPESYYQAISLRPDIRCLTLNSWFQNVYKHAYEYLGKLLYLSEKFPEPHEVFCGSAWTAFYTSNQAKKAPKDKRDLLQHIQDEIVQIIKDNRELVGHVTQNVFSLDHRF